MMTPDINPVELKVFLNHIYELKKGVRQMVLYTTNKRYEDFAVKRLRSQRIKFVIQPVDDERINLFFGKAECIEAIRMMVTRPLNLLTPEEEVQAILHPQGTKNGSLKRLPFFFQFPLYVEYP